MSGFLLGSAVLGVVVGTAAQSSLGKLFAGFMLSMARPFRPGDWVAMRSSTLGGTEFNGVIVQVGSLYVTLLAHGQAVRLPNNVAIGAAARVDDRPLRVALQAGRDSRELDRGWHPVAVRPLDIHRIRFVTRHVSVDDASADGERMHNGGGILMAWYEMAEIAVLAAMVLVAGGALPWVLINLVRTSNRDVVQFPAWEYAPERMYAFNAPFTAAMAAPAAVQPALPTGVPAALPVDGRPAFQPDDTDLVDLMRRSGEPEAVEHGLAA